MAILQYRLWDLDVVVKKTVVAGLLVLLAIAVRGGRGAIGLLAIDYIVLRCCSSRWGSSIAFRPAMVGR